MPEKDLGVIAHDVIKAPYRKEKMRDSRRI